MRRIRILCAVLPVLLLDRFLPLRCAFIFVAATIVSPTITAAGQSNECTNESVSDDSKGEIPYSCKDNIDDSAGSPEEKDTGDSETDDNKTGENISSPWAFMNAFSKVGTSWNHIIGEYISVIRSAEGKDLLGDVFAEKGVDEALPLLHGLVKKAAMVSEEDGALWSFRTTPLKEFDKTIDHILIAFLRWSAADSNDVIEGVCTLIGDINKAGIFEGTINVSKAFRRLTAYVQWMESVSSDILEPPLTFGSVEDSLSVFSIRVTHDQCGRLVWWVDLGKSDLKSREPRETIRLFVWVAHLLFLDEGAQTKGLVVADDMAKISFLDYMTMLPVQVGLSVDRFLISVIPVRTKNVLMINLPRWMEIGYGLLSWFLTARMKSRCTMVQKNRYKEDLIGLVGDESYIPVEFGDAGGTLTVDMIADLKHAS